MTVSVIIPTLNEEQVLGATLDVLKRLPARTETIVADGGSSDRTVAIARGRGCRIVFAERGRGNQLHAGAGAAHGNVLWFLHADTHPPPEAVEWIAGALNDPQVAGGHFRVKFDGARLAARCFTCIYACAQRFGLCYGDSAYFIRREAYERAGGFRPLPIFEDLDLRRRVLRLGRFVRVRGTVTTSARRFEGRSAALTLARWMALQVLYWLGVPPQVLGHFYAAIRGNDRSSGKGTLDESATTQSRIEERRRPLAAEPADDCRSVVHGGGMHAIGRVVSDGADPPSSGATAARL